MRRRWLRRRLLSAPSRRWSICFLYVPIAVLVALSFNEGGLPTVWSGFSTEWYGTLAGNRGDPVARRSTR